MRWTWSSPVTCGVTLGKILVEAELIVCVTADAAATPQFDYMVTAVPKYALVGLSSV